MNITIGEIWHTDKSASDWVEIINISENTNDSLNPVIKYTKKFGRVNINSELFLKDFLQKYSIKSSQSPYKIFTFSF